LSRKTERPARATRSLAGQPLAALLGELDSAAVAPGAGAAAAIALALAAACAGKAVAISLRHRPQDRTLRAAHPRVVALRAQALKGAAEDARRFAQFVHARSRASAARMLAGERNLQHCAARLERLLRSLRGRIEPVVRADIRAAHVLCGAFQRIQAANLAEGRRALAHPRAGVRGMLRRQERQP